MFSQPESAEISKQFTAVKMTGGDDLDDEGRAFMQRYDVGGYPTLLAMTSDGAMVTKDIDRSTDGILSSMTQAAKTNEAFVEKEGALSKKEDEASVRELSGLYRDRMQFDKARAGFEKLIAAKPLIDDQIALLDILESSGEKDGRKKLLGTLLETYKDHEERINWRIQLATIDVPTSINSREEYVDAMSKQKAALSELLASIEKKADQAVVRAKLADALGRTGDREGALEHFEWILENARDSSAAAAALMMVANAKWPAAQGDLEKMTAVYEMLKELVDKHGDHEFANHARRALPQIQAAIDKAKAEAEAEPEDDDDKDDDDDDDK